MAVENGKIASGELKDTDKVVVDSFAALSPNDFDDTPTAGSNKLMTSGAIKEALEEASEPSDYAQVKAQVQQNTQDIAGIEDKIPAQASAQNQLADKAFVNSSIATNTATFRGTYNLVSDLGLTTSATEQAVASAIATHLAALVPPVVPENNDYCFVQVPRETSDPTVIDRIDRYKCTVTESGGVTTRAWEYEWSLNNSSFTAAQWAAINSGITSALVTKLGALPTADELAAALLGKADKVANATSGNLAGLDGNGNLMDSGKKPTDFAPATNIAKTALASDVQTSLGKADTALQTAPVTSVNSKTGAVVLGASDVGALGNSGDQTLMGTLKALGAGGLVETLNSSMNEVGVRAYNGSSYAVKYLADGIYVSTDGEATYTKLSLPNVAGTLALVSQIYAAVQQIAPAWVSGTTYAADALVSYNGAIYARRTSGSITSSTNPASDTTNWEAKKVSELFLPLTGGTVSGEVASGFGFSLKGIGGISLADAFYDSALKIWLNGGYTVSFPNAYGTLALLQNLAADYSTSATYALNALCVNSGKLYRCTTAITTAEAWTAAHWTEATVEDVLAAIRTALADKAPLASPAFTGTPTAPNMDAQSTDGQVANKKYVDDKVAGATPNLDYVMRVDPETGNIYYTTPDEQA